MTTATLPPIARSLSLFMASSSMDFFDGTATFSLSLFAAFSLSLCCFLSLSLSPLSHSLTQSLLFFPISLFLLAFVPHVGQNFLLLVALGGCPPYVRTFLHLTVMAMKL